MTQKQQAVKNPSPRLSVKIEGAGLTFIMGFAGLLLFQLLGEVTVRLLNISMPGPVIGLVYMLVFLILNHKLRGSEPLALTQVSSSLLTHLSLLFIPAGVGVITHLDKISSQWQPIVISLLVGSFVTLAVTAWSLKFLLKIIQQDEPQ